MSEEEQQELGKTLWKIADNLRGSMNADDSLPHYAINTLA
jgi:type I restriction enzyme M protein